MPNWCRNRVTAYARNGNEQDIQKIQEIFESKDTVFGKIIPSPDWNNTPNQDGELPVKIEHKNSSRKRLKKKHVRLVLVLKFIKLRSSFNNSF